jgi:fructose-1,6-bisphosphatase/inositol monophosphatase family enzyme
MAFQESPPPSRGRAGWGVFPPRATMPGHSLAESDIAARFAAAQALAREAGALAVALRGGPAASFAVESKSALDFATEADRAVERLVIERLGKRFGDGVLGEEYGAQQEAVDRLWVVDPVDGTFNFMHGLPVWCVSLAFMLAGEIEIGIIYNPDGNEMFTARRGRGAFLDGAPIKVSAGRHAAPLVEVGHSNRAISAWSAASLAPVASSAVSAPARSGSHRSPPAAPTAISSCTSIPGTSSPACCWCARPAAGPTISSPATGCAAATRSSPARPSCAEPLPVCWPARGTND